MPRLVSNFQGQIKITTNSSALQELCDFIPAILINPTYIQNNGPNTSSVEDILNDPFCINNIDFVKISGVVYIDGNTSGNSEGQTPVGGIKVTATSTTGNSISTFTNSDGEYSFYFVDEDDYT